MTSLPSWAVPGRKVVCVRGGEIPNSRGFGTLVGFPIERQIYTIRATGQHWSGSGPCLKLHELPNPGRTLGGDFGWALSRFRPVVSLEDDMLTFRSLLNTVPATNHSEELTNV